MALLAAKGALTSMAKELDKKKLGQFAQELSTSQFRLASEAIRIRRMLKYLNDYINGREIPKWTDIVAIPNGVDVANLESEMADLAAGSTFIDLETDIDMLRRPELVELAHRIGILPADVRGKNVQELRKMITAQREASSTEQIRQVKPGISIGTKKPVNGNKPANTVQQALPFKQVKRPVLRPANRINRP